MQLCYRLDGHLIMAKRIHKIGRNALCKELNATLRARTWGIRAQHKANNFYAASEELEKRGNVIDSNLYRCYGDDAKARSTNMLERATRMSARLAYNLPQV